MGGGAGGAAAAAVTTIKIKKIITLSVQTWDWGKVKKEENDAGVWVPQ